MTREKFVAGDLSGQPGGAPANEEPREERATATLIVIFRG
jgi:hypothetical protein